MLIRRKPGLMLIVTVLAVGLLVSGCGGGGSRRTSISSISGQVTDEAGLPISGAVVRAGGQVITTGASGSFNLTGIVSGRTRVWVTAEEYEPHWRTLDLPAGARSLGQVKLVASPGTSFHSVQMDRGSGSISLSNLTTESVSIVVSSRNTADGDIVSTRSTSPDLIATSLPGHRFKGAARRVLGLPSVGLSLHDFLRESEWEVLHSGFVTQSKRTPFLFGDVQFDTVGDTDQFWVLKSDATRPASTDWENVTATLKYTSDDVYVYVDNDDLGTVTQAVIDGLGDSFSDPNGIYDTTRGYFGDEPSPGIDNRTPIYVLLSNALPNTYAGYFWGINELSDEDVSRYASQSHYVLHSNEKEIVFIQPGVQTLLGMKGTLAHEFEHMIFYNERDATEPEPSTWLNEGFATMSEELNNFGLAAGSTDLASQIYYYVKDPSRQSLTEWDEGEDQDDALADYGAVYLFVRYIVDRFGVASPGILKTIMQTPVAARDAVGTAVGMDFDDLFTDWTLAMYLDRRTWVPGSRFNYGDDFFHRTYGGINLDGVGYESGLPSSFSSRQYGVEYAYLGSPGGAITLNFSTSGAPLTDVIVITHK